MEKTLTPRRVTLGGLDTIEFASVEGAPTIVVFHGYGADGADLAPLSPELALSKPARWLFPDAPGKTDWGGRAWFAIDEASIERAQRTGQGVDWAESDPAVLEDARGRAKEFLAAVGAPWKDLVLAGFSQGAILATDLALRAPENPRGLAILSGNLVNAGAWKALAARRAGLPFFQSHGIADPILGYQGARKLEALLREGGLDGRLLSFEGGHAIPPQAQSGLKSFLEAVL